VTQTLRRDPSTGRFIKSTPSEKVAAHVERVNSLHGVATNISHLPEDEIKKRFDDWAVSEQGLMQASLKAEIERQHALAPSIAQEVADLGRPRPAQETRDPVRRFIEGLPDLDQKPMPIIKRSQPIEYDKPNWIFDNWLWMLPTVLGLIGLTVFLAMHLH
jgi:hypothetical protein